MSSAPLRSANTLCFIGKKNPHLIAFRQNPSLTNSCKPILIVLLSSFSSLLSHSNLLSPVYSVCKIYARDGTSTIIRVQYFCLLSNAITVCTVLYLAKVAGHLTRQCSRYILLLTLLSHSYLHLTFNQ